MSEAPVPLARAGAFVWAALLRRAQQFSCERLACERDSPVERSTLHRNSVARGSRARNTRAHVAGIYRSIVVALGDIPEQA